MQSYPGLELNEDQLACACSDERVVEICLRDSKTRILLVSSESKGQTGLAPVHLMVQSVVVL